MSITTDVVRNVAIAGHGDTGKTTLVEQMLFNGGVIAKAESVESGKTVSDYTEEEIERQISIHTSITNVTWHDRYINLLDTPGSADFVGEVVAAFRTAESVIMTVAADAGVQIETIKLWRRLDKRNLPRLVFVNKMDKERADFSKTFADVKDKFKTPLVPVTIPIGEGANYKGVVNLIENKAYLIPEAGEKEKPTDIPADMAEMVEEYRLTLIEAAAEGEDALMEKYFEEGTLSEDEIRQGLQSGFAENRVVPLLCGVTEVSSGIVSLLNFLANNAPHPDVCKEHAEDPEGNSIELPISSEGPTAAFVFKTTIDQFSGKLSFIKVMSGIIEADSEYSNFRDGKKVRVSKIYKAEGKKISEVKDLVAGEIGVLAKIESAATNDTFCAQDRPLALQKLALPKPVHSLAISAASKKEEDKLNQFLNRAAEQDLTFTVEFNAETKETVISGMGELHINMILDRIREKQKVEMETRTPKIAYRETITKPADAEYTHKKQSGGHGQYGRVVMNIGPIERGQHMVFENAIKGGSISKGYMPGIEKGILEAMEEGFLAGYPIVDIKATIVDGKEHPVDSSEMAFKLAGKGALRAAIEKAKPVLLEPMMTLKVFTEETYLGDILSDLSSKRGRVLGQEPLGGGIIEIDAQVPQAEMLGYSIDLRSITSGTASFEMEFDHYSPLSGSLATKVIEQSKAQEEQ